MTMAPFPSDSRCFWRGTEEEAKLRGTLCWTCTWGPPFWRAHVSYKEQELEASLELLGPSTGRDLEVFASSGAGAVDWQGFIRVKCRSLSIRADSEVGDLLAFKEDRGKKAQLAQEALCKRGSKEPHLRGQGRVLGSLPEWHRQASGW